MRIRHWLIGVAAIFLMTPLHGAAAQKLPAAAVIGAPQIGMPVFSTDGQKIGSVESINTRAGKAIVLVSTGSVMGFGTRLVAIPLSRFDLENHHVRVKMTADDVAALPHQGP